MPDTIQLRSVISGDGPPLIILHGLFGQAKNWTALARKFGEHFTIHALDLRNHGQSPHTNGMSYQEMADDVLAYMDAQGIDQAQIIGHSMGGKVSMLACLDQPTRFERAIFADIAPVAYSHNFDRQLAAMDAIDLANLKSRQDADSIMAAHIADVGVRAFLGTNLARDGSNGWQWLVNREAIAADIDQIIGWPDMDGARYDGPALFLAGAKSDYMTPDMMPVAQRLFPNAEYDEIADAGHWLHAEQPEAFFNRSLEFLAQA